jgi:excisionase family DNA binding protein
VPDSYVRNRRDAAISIARLTLSDSGRRGNWAFRYRNLHLVVDASPLVMAIWSLSGQTWTSPTRSAGAPGNTETQDRNTGPGGEATHMSARTPEAEPLLTPAEVATMFRVDPKTVTRWAKAGKLTSIRTLGGHRRYRETEVRALLAGIPQQRSE